MSLLDVMPMGALILDRHQSVVSVNPAFLRFLGYREAQVLGRAFRELLATANAQGPNDLPCPPETRRGWIELHFLSAEAKTLMALVACAPLIDASGVTERVLVTILGQQDVAAIRETERRLLQAETVYATAHEGILVTDAQGHIVAVNPAFTRITGYTESEVLGRKPNLLNSHWHPHSYFVGMWRLLARRGAWQGDIWNRRKNGEIYLQQLTIRRVLDARGKLVNFVSVFAERGHPQPPCGESLTYYDSLTKLPNRLLFESRLERAIELARRRESALALILFDLDHFSHINSSLGHQIGDELLRSVALRLRIAIRPADTLARLRADQFALIFDEVERIADIERIAERLQATLRAEFRIRSHQVYLTASLGIAFDTGMGCDRNALLAHAETALRQVKRLGRTHIQISPVEPDAAAQEHRHLIELLRAGIEKGEFRLMYRPEVDMETDCDESVEALLRWDQPEIGSVPRERFLALASESGLMAELGLWKLRTACRQLQRWLDNGLPIGGLSVRVSETQFTQGDLLQVLERLLEETPKAASRLTLEFSESLLQKHPKQIAEVFDGLRCLGVAIALNEVGSGWVSPTRLRQLPVKTLKIYPSFIESLPDSRDDLAVVQALVAMAQALDLEILADGVRTEEQRQLLMTIGCRLARGPLFGESLLARQFERRLDPKPTALPTLGLGN